MAHPALRAKTRQLTRSQAYESLSEFEAGLEATVKTLAWQLLGLLDDEGSVSLKNAYAALFPLAETTVAAELFSTLTKKLQDAATKNGVVLCGQLSGSKQTDVAKRRFVFIGSRAVPTGGKEGLDAMRSESRIMGYLPVPLSSAPIILLTYNTNEFNAIRTRFWQGTGNPSQRGSGEDMVDDLGVLNGWPILHAYSRQGNRESQRTVESLRCAYSPFAIISVGIAFGLNAAEQLIGDVLISKFLIDYESTREGPKGTTLRSVQKAASRVLLQAFEQLDVRQKGVPGWPRLLIGGMLCGEKLLDNALFRNRLVKLARHPDLVGGEMEGIGLATALDGRETAWVVVKAICDFGDGNKNTRRKEANQRRAAQNAAHVVRVMLEGNYLAKPQQPPKNPTNPKESTQSSPPQQHDPQALGVGTIYMRTQLARQISPDNLQAGGSNLNAPQMIAFDHIWAWLTDPGAPPLYALFGEYGMGKTTHCKNIAFYLEAQRNVAGSGNTALPVPLYFDLSKVEKIAAADRGVPGHVPTLEETINDCLRNGYSVRRSPGSAGEAVKV